MKLLFAAIGSGIISENTILASVLNEEIRHIMDVPDSVLDNVK